MAEKQGANDFVGVFSLMVLLLVSLSFSVAYAAGDGFDYSGLSLSHSYNSNPADDFSISEEALMPFAPGQLGEMAREKLALGELTRKQDGDDPRSRIEQLYDGRVVEHLEQFGYNYLNSGRKDHILLNSEIDAPIAGVQDSYVLNIGDEVDIVIRGQKNDRKTYLVDSQGRLVVDDLSPFMAAGRTLGDVKADIRSAIRDTLHNTSVFVSMAGIKQSNILVVGHVREPGLKIVSSFDSLVDVLIKAGGIDKTGSLRQIRVVRGGVTKRIDLYDILLQSRPAVDISLRSGDRIIVPPIGPTVGVGGAVNRPGIYELLPSAAQKYRLQGTLARKISPIELLNWAGGLIDRGVSRFVLIDPARDGQDHVAEVTSPFKAVIGAGGILMAMSGEKKKAGQVTLAGQTRRPGLYALNQTHSLSALLHSPSVLGSDIYPLIGVIARFDEPSLAHEYLSFSPRDVLDGIEDRHLVDGDTIHLFSMKEVRMLGRKKASFKEESSLSDPLLVTFLNERMVRLSGEVRRPGAYPVAGTISLAPLLKAAGGTKKQADLHKVELLYTGQTQGSRTAAKRKVHNLKKEDPETILVSVGDAVRIGATFQGIEDSAFVLVQGEVKKPGQYPLIRGEKLSSLIKRAGGLTEQAYPEGVIFSRATERRREAERFRVAARDLEQSLAAAMQDDDRKPNASEVQTARQLAKELRSVKAVGRITVEADPDMLSMHPEQDILLEKGDKLYIPKRPLNVRVSGEVLSPASLQFRTDKKPHDYLGEAGGYTYYADKDRAFVLYPDGHAQPLHINTWSHKPVMITPGSTIVVPRDPKPFDFIESARDFTQILTNLAVTGLFLDDIADND